MTTRPLGPYRGATSVVVNRQASQGGATQVRSRETSMPEDTYRPSDLDTPAKVSAAMQRVQRSVNRAIRGARTLPVNGGVYFQDQKLTANALNTIAHGLQAPVSFAICRLRATSNVAPVVVEAGQTADGRLQLATTSNCVVDMWIFPQPGLTALGATAKVAPPFTTSTPTNVTPIVVTSGGGWTTALDLDFTAQATQTLSPDGSYTIGGLAWTKENSANDATAMKITLGTGLVIIPTAPTGYSAVGRSAPLIRLPLSTLFGATSFDWGTSLRIYVSMGSEPSPYSGNGQYIAAAIDSDSTAVMAILNRGTFGGTQNFQFQAVGNGTAYVASGFGTITLNAANRTFVVEIPALAQPPGRLYDAASIAAGASFPALSGYALAGVSGVSTGGFFATGQTPANLGLVLAGATPSGIGATYVVQRIRVDYRN